MSRKNKESKILGNLLVKIAPRLGAKVLLEPKWQIAGQIFFKNGKHSFFRYNTLDLNPVGASDIAKDKDYANFFMQKMNYPIVPSSKTFFSDEWAEAIGAKNKTKKEALKYAQKIGWPVIIKPNSGSQGKNVALVFSSKETEQALRKIFRKDKIALIQKFLIGDDYRLVVLDKKVISAYQRIPLHILGDAQSNILQLIEKKQKKFLKEKRDSKIKINDWRILNKLKRKKMDFNYVPAKGEKIYLLDNANLSSGGEAIEVTDKIHSSFKKMAIQLTKDMGLRFCGVDLIVQGDITKPKQKFYILEINAAPGLDHYFKTGREQQKIVENLYLKVLRSLEKN